LGVICDIENYISIYLFLFFSLTWDRRVTYCRKNDQ